MNRRRKGNINEDRSADILNDIGYLTITSRASAGMIDVVGVYMGNEPDKHPLVRLIQSKTGYMPPAELNMLRKLVPIFRQNGASVRVEGHTWKKYRRSPDIVIVNEIPEDDFQLQIAEE